MNRHGEKERLTSVLILRIESHFKTRLIRIMLLRLMSFEVATLTTMDSQEPAYDGHLLAS